jgi:hypothetical protein
MTTDTAESAASQAPTSLQTGTTPNPTPSNAQDFSGSDDEILDNFAAGPDDGIPMGLGGESGKQSEPASSTLEADIANGTTKQSGEKLPSDSLAGEPESAQEPASEEGAETSPEPASSEPETPEFPPALLRMAGYADATEAQTAGFQDPESLFAAVRWRGQLLTPGSQPTQSDSSSEQGLYRRPAQQPTSPSPSAPEVVATEGDGDVKPFELSADKREILDEDLVAVLDEMNQHYQQELKSNQQELESLRSSVGKRESDLARQQEQDEEAMFDKAVQGLGEEWQDVFGEGSGVDLARTGQNDPAAMTSFHHRALLFETVEAVREVNAKQGYKPMDLEQEVQWALLQRYPDKFQQTISGNSNGSANGSGQRRGVTASRPTQRKTPSKSRNAKVLSDVSAMLTKKGRAPLDMGQEEELEGEI